MPSSSRDFQRAAQQRLDAAEYLLKGGYNRDAMYLAGYTVECTFKALILEATDAARREGTLRKISSGRKMHNPEILGGVLKELGRPIPPELLRKIGRSGWSTGFRYGIGRPDTGETRGFLKAAKTAYNWVERQLP